MFLNNQCLSLKKNQNAHRPSQHPTVWGEKISKRLGGIKCCKFKTSSWPVVVVVVVSHIQRIGCQPEKTTLHGGQSRSWSAEQGKENKRKSLAAYPPRHPPHCSFGEKKESKRYLKKNQNAPRPSAVVFFTLTDRASTIPSKSTGAPICNTVLQIGAPVRVRGCQSGTWSAGPTRKISEEHLQNFTVVQREQKNTTKTTKRKEQQHSIERVWYKCQPLTIRYPPRIATMHPNA